MDVSWLEQTESDVPAGNQWLSAGEILCLSGLRFAKRRADWLLGRWTAKRAVVARLNLSADLCALANIEIQAAPSGAPEVFLFNQQADITISLSHRSGRAACSVALSRTSLGCDLELVEPRSPEFVADYFTPNERSLVKFAPQEEQSLLVTLCWSAKESALKALQVGLRLDTNCMDVNPFGNPPPAVLGRQHSTPVSLLAPTPAEWRPLRVRYADAQIFHGWWRHADDMVRTVISALPLRPPISLPCSSSRSSYRLPEDLPYAIGS